MFVIGQKRIKIFQRDLYFLNLFFVHLKNKNFFVDQLILIYIYIYICVCVCVCVCVI